jgi:hypothetical protein
VTVQNLLEQTMGLDSLNNFSGVKVFFSITPVVVSGEGAVDIANEDGIDAFTAGAQPYFLYNQTLSPFEISNGRLWQFNVDNTVVSFVFEVVVSAPLSSGKTAERGAVWQGDVDSLWTTAGNWQDGIVPDSNTVVNIPLADSVVNMPKLTGPVAIKALRVGPGSTLRLAGFTLAASGNVDAVGTIGGGTVRMTGAGALLRGNVDALVLTGGIKLQSAAKATGAVSLQDGSLNLNGQALSISVP